MAGGAAGGWHDFRAQIRGPNYLRLFSAAIAVCAGVASFFIAQSGAYLVYSFLNILLLRSIWWRRFSWSYCFLAILFLLGHWFKITVHGMFDYPFIEPTGLFAGRPDQWDRYYLFTSSAMVALMFGRVLLLTPLGLVFRSPKSGRARVPSPSDWAALSLVILVFYAVNDKIGFYRTGINETTPLPFPLNAIGAFLAFIGLAIVVAWNISDELAARGTLGRFAWATLLLQGTVGAISMGSRLTFILHVFPVLIVVLTTRRAITYRRTTKYVAGFTAALVIVLAMVSVFRIRDFYGSDTSDIYLVNKLALESADLAVDRWVGAEAVLVGVSWANASMERLEAVLLERPAEGASSIYQVAAGSFYTNLETRTFLTLPGAFGLLSLSGSIAVMFFGSLCCMLVGWMVESWSAILSSNRRPVVVLVSAGIANALCQMSFPYLLLPFVVQLLALLAILSAFQKR